MSADWISVQSGSDNTKMVEDQKILQYDFDNLNISFNGCGFLGVYHVGVASALHHYLPNMEFNYVCGASAGAMAGSCLVGKIPLGRKNHQVCQKFEEKPCSTCLDNIISKIQVSWFHGTTQTITILN